MSNTVEILDLSVDERHTLARKAGIKAIYLWQCGAGIRTPSLTVAEKLIKYEQRLTITTLMAPKHRRDSRLQKKAK